MSATIFTLDSTAKLSFTSPDGRWARTMPLDALPISGTPVDDHGEEYDFGYAVVRLSIQDKRQVSDARNITLTYTHPDGGDTRRVALSEVLAAGGRWMTTTAPTTWNPRCSWTSPAPSTPTDPIQHRHPRNLPPWVFLLFYR